MSSCEPESEPEQEQEQEENDRRVPLLRSFARVKASRIVARFCDVAFPSNFALNSSPRFSSGGLDRRKYSRDSLEEARDDFRRHGLGHGSRSERKIRKAVQKLGMQPAPNIHRVVIKRYGNVTYAISKSFVLNMKTQILYIIAKPEVYRCPETDTYVIFGQGEFEDVRNQTRQSAVEQFSNQSQAEASDIKDDVIVEEEESDTDEEGLNAKDVELVMTQASVSRSRAVRALKKFDHDMVSAIMELTIS